MLTMIALASCSSSQGNSTVNVPNSAWSDHQAAAMDDGKATTSEYREGFRRFAACLSAAGFELAQVDESGDVIKYGVPDAAVQSGVDAECYEREFEALDTAWQLATPNPEMIAMYTKCLQRNSLSVPNTEDEMYKALVDAGVDPLTCV